MSIKDERALDTNEEHLSGASNGPSSDIDRVLQLIAAQIDDADRRQAQVLEQLAGRLERLEAAGTTTRSDPVRETNHNDESGAIDAQAERDPAPIAVGTEPKIAIPEWSADEHEAHAFVEALFEKRSADAGRSETAPSSNAPDTASEQPERQQDVWADNAADLDYAAEHDADAFDFRADSADTSNTNVDAQHQEQSQHFGDVVGNLHDAAFDATGDQFAADDAEKSQAQPFDEASFASEVPAISVSGNADDPWSDGDAERLMQVYDNDVFKHKEDAPVTPGFENTDTAASADDAYDAAPIHSAHFENAIADNQPTTHDEREWLENRFSEIALRVEQTLEEMRADDPVRALREHFAQFQEDMVGAVGDMATRTDIESLKAVEGELDELREHFAHVQEQLSRLDSVEKQLEAVIDRLSDDRLMTLLSGTSQSGQPDHAEFAAVVGEYVANRVADRQPQNVESDGKLDRLEAVLTDFIEEQRAGASHQTGVLDTLQDAMVQVLDRVEQQATTTPMAFAPPTNPQDAFSAREQTHDDALEQYAPAEDTLESSLDEAPMKFDSDAGLEPSAYGMSADDRHYGPKSESITADPLDADDDAFQSNPSAIEAANQVAGRHPDFEPFSDNAGTSLATPPPVSAEMSDVPQAAEQQPAYADDASDVPQSAPADEEPAPLSGNSVARLRQEFINEARRAKEHADTERAMSGGVEPEEDKPGGFSLFGVSLGGAKKSAPSTNDTSHTVQTELSHDFEQMPVIEEPKIFGISRKKVLLGAFILMIAASGALLLMPRGGQPASTSAPIEHVEPRQQSQMLETPRAPARAEPAPARAGTVAPPAPPAIPAEAANPVRKPAPRAAAPQPADTKFQSDSDIDIKSSGDRSDIGDAWSRTMGSLRVPARPAKNYLDGVALQIPKKPLTPAGLAHLSNQRSMAHWSLKLGDAASRARTSDLLPEYHPTNVVAETPAPVEKAALKISRDVTLTPTSKTRTRLALPPATVGPLSLRIAAAKGDASAEFEVGARLASGKGTQQDFKKAIKWYSRSASRGFAQSQYRLGTLFERGLGVKKDAARARVWYTRAAEQGNIKAMHNLAVLSAGTNSGALDYAKAAAWFAKAAEFGLADSQFNLAVLHENGLGVDQDLKRAFELYALSASSGDRDAAKRRDALKPKLRIEDLASAEAHIQNWRALRSQKLANDPLYAGQQWKKSATSSYLR